MLITGQNTIVGTLNLNLRDEFQRAYRPLAIVDAQTIDVSDKFRFAPELLDAIDDGFVTVAFENEDFADQADVGTSINDYVATGDGFTISHNNRLHTRIHTSPTGSFFKANETTPIAAGTVVGQELRISLVPNAFNDQDTIVIYYNRSDPSTCWTNGNWVAFGDDIPFIDLVWDGTRWYEQERGNATGNATGLDSKTENDSESFGEGSFAATSSRAIGNSSTAFGGGVASGPNCFAEGGVAGIDYFPCATQAPDTVIVLDNRTNVLFNGDEIFITNIDDGSGRIWSNRNVITNVLFDGTNTVLTVGNGDNVSGAIPVDTEGAQLWLVSGNVSSAHSEGAGTRAEGECSHAEGFNCTASGENSHAEGHGSDSFGGNSHAEGESLAYGFNSHSEGNQTEARARESHAEGDGSRTFGEDSHAEGTSTIVGFAASSFSISGSTITISGDATERFSNSDDIFFFGLTGGTNNLVNNEQGNISSTPTFDGSDTTFNVSITLDDRTGGFCFSPRGRSAHAEGDNSRAIGNVSHAEGLTTIAKGQNSHAEGNFCYAIGNNSHAEGFGTSSIGLHSHAEGGGGGGILKAVGDYGHAEGKDTLCMAHYGHTEGEDTRSGNLPRDYSYDPNTSTVTIPGDFTSEYHDGDNVRFWDRPGARVQDSTISSVTFAMSNTTFIATISINIGMCVVPAFGEGSHAEGDQTHAYGESSHAEGANSFAFGAQSHAAGLFSVARQTAQHSVAAGVFAIRGDAQSTELISKAQTTDGTPTELYIDLGTTERILIPINSTFGYSIKVIARQTGGTSACAYFTLDGFITRDVGVATTRLVTGSSNTTSDGTASTWTLVESADTGNGALVLTATGEAAKNINWVAHIRLVETFE